jgi:tetratricopeptide (TPR) repeat protein
VIYADGGDDVVVVSGGGRVVVREGEGASEPAQAGESVQGAGSGVDPAVAGVLGRGPDTLSRLATQYLADGDAAFRERRYGDAAHFYAKAIEYRPDEGVLYLVLSDALFATGDYHYGAFALRRALELDPSLATSDLDKHEFYSDPTEFDRQLQVLERFLADHVTDVDARILLAANYLFSRKPELTVDLLEAGTSEAARNDSAGKLLLASAKHSLARKP